MLCSRLLQQAIVCARHGPRIPEGAKRLRKFGFAERHGILRQWIGRQRTSLRMGSEDGSSSGSRSNKYGRLGSWVTPREATRVHLALLAVQLGYGGYYVLTKLAMSDGVNQFVFAVYRDCIGLALLAPLAFFSERHVRTAFTSPVLLYIVALGFLGIYLQQTLFLAGLTFTNTAFAAAMQNAIPVFTFLIAVICRNEVIRLKKLDGVAKTIGIISCVTGALTMSLYKGPTFLGSDTVPAAETEHLSQGGWLTSALLRSGVHYWQIGSACLILNCLCMGTYTNLQIPALKIFPAPASLTAGSICVGVVSLVITGILSVSDGSQWVLNQPGNILSVVYAGAIASGFNFTLQTWANQRGGPILVAVYIPLQTVFSAFLGLIVLDEPVYLGTLIGALLILAGLYLVVWGQRAHQLALTKESLAGDVEKPLLS